MQLKGHEHLFQRCVAAALADTVYCRVKLFGSGFCPSQGIGQGHAQVVMAVHTDGDLHHLFDFADHVVGCPRIHDPNGVRNAYVIRMVLLCLFVQLLQCLEVRSCGVLSRESHDEAVVLGILHSI